FCCFLRIVFVLDDEGYQPCNSERRGILGLCLLVGTELAIFHFPRVTMFAGDGGYLRLGGVCTVGFDEMHGPFIDFVQILVWH
ncbi:hypothetical protein NPN23_24065, partial [Vibrio parahaemolyticus]|nr:hypothetical protein [Vibrio parahaemolyticus]